MDESGKHSQVQNVRCSDRCWNAVITSNHFPSLLLWLAPALLFTFVATPCSHSELGHARPSLVPDASTSSVLTLRRTPILVVTITIAPPSHPRPSSPSHVRLPLQRDGLSRVSHASEVGYLVPRRNGHQRQDRLPALREGDRANMLS